MFEMDFPDDFMECLKHPFEEVAPKILEDAAPILLESTKTALRSVIKHPGDSELVNSVKSSKPKVTNTDACIVACYPTGYSKNTYTKGSRKYPVTNAAKAFWLEYGVAGRQPARPWRDKANNARKAEIESTMQKKYNELMGAEQ